MIFFYVLLSFTIDNTNTISEDSQVKFYLFSFFTVVEYTVFSIFLYLNFKSKTVKRLILITLPLFYALAAYYIINKNGSNYFDAVPASIESILIIIFSVIFFFEQIRDMEVSFISSSKAFWIIVAILVYMSATFFLFVSAEFVSQEERRSYWFINSISNLIKHILLTVAFIIPNHKPRPLSERPFDDGIFDYEEPAH